MTNETSADTLDEFPPEILFAIAIVGFLSLLATLALEVAIKARS